MEVVVLTKRGAVALLILLCLAAPSAANAQAKFGEVVIGAPTNSGQFRLFIKQARSTKGLALEEVSGTDQLRLYHSGTSGIVESSAGSLQLWAGGASQLDVSSTAGLYAGLRLGIGSAAAASGYHLDVNDASATARIRVRATGAANTAVFEVSSGNGTTSARGAVVAYSSSETSPQSWQTGVMAGAKMWRIYDNTAGATRFAVAESTGIATAYSGLTVNGTTTTQGQIVAQATKTANYTATATDYVLLCDATAGAVTVTLPVAASNSGRVYVVKKIDSSANGCVIDPNASETVDGAATLSLTTQYAVRSIVSNGTNWYVIGN